MLVVYYYLTLIDIQETTLKCISKNNLMKYTMWLKSYEHFH